MEWFRHDSNANLDEKLQEVLLDYGLEGYGLYWYCIELIVGKVAPDNINFQLKHDARIIARNTGSTPQKVEEMMKRFVDVGLFENKGGMITCLKVAKRLMTSSTSNVQMRSMIQNIKSNQIVEEPSRHRHDGIMTLSCQIEEIDKKDKIRLDKKEKPSTSILDDGFEEFWNLYPKKVGKTLAQTSWKKSKVKIDDVLKTLQWQIESELWQKQSGQYIPNPATYLNQGRWKDEPSQQFNGSPF